MRIKLRKRAPKKKVPYAGYKRFRDHTLENKIHICLMMIVVFFSILKHEIKTSIKIVIKRLINAVYRDG